jgi:hypothetical protein
MLVAYPPWATTDHKLFSVEPKTVKTLVSIARLPLLPGITCMAAAGQVKAAGITYMQKSLIPGRDEAD